MEVSRLSTPNEVEVLYKQVETVLVKLWDSSPSKKGSLKTQDDPRGLGHQVQESEFKAAKHNLKSLRDLCDPVLMALREAPEDDEPRTEEERKAIDEAKKALRDGQVLSDEELAKKLGLVL